MLVTLVVVAVVWIGWKFRDDARVRVAAVATLAWWVFPLVVGRGVALFRAEALLVPATLVLVRSPLAVSGALLVGAVALLGPMAAMFFANALR